MHWTESSVSVQYTMYDCVIDRSACRTAYLCIFASWSMTWTLNSVTLNCDICDVCRLVIGCLFFWVECRARQAISVHYRLSDHRGQTFVVVVFNCETLSRRVDVLCYMHCTALSLPWSARRSYTWQLSEPVTIQLVSMLVLISTNSQS